MIVRHSQIKTFDAKAQLTFVDELADRVQGMAPQLSAVATESGVRKFVDESVAEAGSCDFHKREPVRFYVESALTLGVGFTADPQYPWARQIVTAIDPEDDRAHLLCAHLFDFLDEVAGPEDAFVRQALQRVLQVLPDTLHVHAVPDRNQALRLTRHCYPQKLEYVGEKNINLLFDRAVEAAGQFGLPQEGWFVVGLLMFAFGHAVLRNPLYPWAAAALTDPNVLDPRAKASRLYDRTRRYLHSILVNSKQVHSQDAPK